MVALDRAARVLGGESANGRAAREDGVRWLLACPDAPHDACLDLANLREEVRRPRTDDPSRHEVLNVRHFTASWVVRALLTPGARDIAREDGLEEQWRERPTARSARYGRGRRTAYGPGPHDTSELRRPMWMTYQGLSALRAHAVWYTTEWVRQAVTKALEDGCMGGRQVLAARRLLAGALDGELPEHERAAAARAVVAELGAPAACWS